MNNIDAKVSFDDEDLVSIEKRKRNEEVLSDRQDRLQRKDFAEKVYSLICYYLGGIFFILLLSGSRNCFSLSDSVLITLLGTTTANVLAILVIVVTYFFHKRKN